METLNEKLAVFTTVNVIKEGLTIEKVYHDHDGAWQFFDGSSTNSYQNAMVVGLGEILKMDPSIREVLNIPPGHFASRTNKNSDWIISKYERSVED